MPKLAKEAARGIHGGGAQERRGPKVVSPFFPIEGTELTVTDRRWTKQGSHQVPSHRRFVLPFWTFPLSGLSIRGESKRRVKHGLAGPANPTKLAVGASPPEPRYSAFKRLADAAAVRRSLAPSGNFVAALTGTRTETSPSKRRSTPTGYVQRPSLKNPVFVADL